MVVGDTVETLSSWELVRRLLKLSWRYRFGCIRVLFLQLVLLFIGLAGLGLSGLGIDYIRSRVVADAKPPAWPFGWGPPPTSGPMLVLAVIAGAILVLAAIRVTLTYGYTVTLARLLQQTIVVDLRAQVYDKLQRLSFRFFDERASGTLINRVTGDVQSVRMFVDSVVMQSIILLISLVTYLVYMLHLHVGLTLACLGTTPVLWLLSVLFSRVARPLYMRNSELVDELVLGLSETIQGIHVVKGFAREGAEAAKFDRASAAVRDQKKGIFASITTFRPAMDFLSQFNLVVLLGYGGYLVIRDQLPLGAGLVVFVGLLQRFAGQISSTADIINSVQQSFTGARRVFEILDTPSEIRSLAAPRALPRARGAVAFENVSFGYDPAERVLSDVSFEVAPGQRVAIVGATGSGKSTVLSLIPRFYDPTCGRVRLDGVDLRELDVDDVRRNIGVVFQESFLFSHTIAANIAFGHPDAGRGQIEAAARVAAAHDFVGAMPQGYDTVLKEAGADLSGGQRQRLAIARAILLDPPILLLDDPTAAVDAHTEHEILEAMENAMKGRTTFLVTHRFSTLRRADLILVLDRGRIVQSGTHDALLHAKGPYRRAARLQFAEDAPSGAAPAAADREAALS